MTRHTIHQIAPHVRWLSPDGSTDRPVLGVVAGAEASLIVDAGNSPDHAAALLAALESLPPPNKVAPPRIVALTHWHWDHVFGVARLGLPAIAHRETARIIRVMAGLDWGDAALDQRVAEGREIAFCRDMLKLELPDRRDLAVAPPAISFEGMVEIDLGGVTCQIIHVGGDHAPDSCVVWVPEDRVVFLGDCIYDDLHHGPRRLTAGALFPLLERLRALGAEHYLPSHAAAPMDAAAFAAEADLLTAIGREVGRRGDDEAAILAGLPAVLGEPLTDDHREIAAAFLAGLRMPSVASVL